MWTDKAGVCVCVRALVLFLSVFPLCLQQFQDRFKINWDPDQDESMDGWMSTYECDGRVST